MKTAWVIAKREIQSFFDSLIAYFLLVIFLGLSGFFTWISGSDIFFVGQASLASFFNIAFWTFFLFIPAVTMRLLAEERKTGTLELLLTKSITDRQVVLGKYIAAMILLIIGIGLTFPYIFSVASIGNLDLGATLSGYLGLILMSSCYVAIGLFVSSVTNNQVVAYLGALALSLPFHILSDVLADSFKGMAGKIVSFFSMSGHFESISRGVIDSRDLVFFISITLLGLFLTEFSLAKRKIA